MWSYWPLHMTRKGRGHWVWTDSLPLFGSATVGSDCVNLSWLVGKWRQRRRSGKWFLVDRAHWLQSAGRLIDSQVPRQRETTERLWDDSCIVPLTAVLERFVHWETKTGQWMLRTLFYWLILTANRWLELHSKLTRPAGRRLELVGDVYDEKQVICIIFLAFPISYKVVVSRSTICIQCTRIVLMQHQKRCTKCLNTRERETAWCIWVYTPKLDRITKHGAVAAATERMIWLKMQSQTSNISSRSSSIADQLDRNSLSSISCNLTTCQINSPLVGLIVMSQTSCFTVIRNEALCCIAYMLQWKCEISHFMKSLSNFMKLRFVLFHLGISWYH